MTKLNTVAVVTATGTGGQFRRRWFVVGGVGAKNFDADIWSMAEMSLAVMSSGLGWTKAKGTGSMRIRASISSGPNSKSVDVTLVPEVNATEGF
jgi:hypothetical protein